VSTWIGKSNPVEKLVRRVVWEFALTSTWSFVLGQIVWDSWHYHAPMDWVDWLFVLLGPPMMLLSILGIVREIRRVTAAFGRTASMVPRQCWSPLAHDWHLVERVDGEDWYCLGREPSREQASDE